MIVSTKTNPETLTSSHFSYTICTEYTVFLLINLNNKKKKKNNMATATMAPRQPFASLDAPRLRCLAKSRLNIQNQRGMHEDEHE